MLPQLPRTELRIHKPLYQACVRSLLRQIATTRRVRFFPQGFLHEMLHRRRQAQPFDSLRSPLRRNLVARRSPHFFGIALEKSEIKLTTEPIDEKVLEALL